MPCSSSPRSARSWPRSTCRSSTWRSPTSRRRTPTPARRRCRGSSPRTPSCSERCSSSADAPVIGSAASASSSAASSCSCSARSSAASPPTSPTLVGARALQGVGAAFLVPASVALLIGAYPPERRMQIVAQWGGIGALAVATGPSLGAAIVSAGGWRWAFFVNIPVGLFVLLVRTTGADRVRSATRSRRRPTTSASASCRWRWRHSCSPSRKGSTWGWTDGRILGAFAVALVAGAVFVHRTLHHDDPVIDPALFHSRPFVIANSATVVYATGFFAMLLGNILFLTGVWDYSIMTGRSRRHARAGRRRHHRRTSRQVGGVASGSDRCSCSARSCFAIGLATYIALVTATPNYLGDLAARHAARRASASGSRSPSSAPARCRRSHRHASPWAAPSTRPPARSAARSASPCSWRSSDPSASSPIRSTGSTSCGRSPPPPQ